jgi:hypothetical protein
MAIGIVAFFGFCAVASQGAIAWASVGWVAFVGLWLYAARRDQLARPRPERSPRAFLLLTAALWIVVIAATAIAGHPPWLVIGLAHAAWGILNGALAVRRGRYA